MVLASSHFSDPTTAKAVDFITHHPYLSLCSIPILLLAIRWLRTRHLRWQLQHSPQSSLAPHPPPLIPPTLPFIGHVVSNAISYQGYMNTLSRHYNKCSALTLPMLSSKHHVIIAPSLVHQVFTSRDVTNKFSGEPFFFGLMETVFGDDKKLIRNMDQEVLWGPVAKSVQGMMRESFLGPALAALNEGVGDRIFDLVSFDAGPGRRRSWEQDAHVSVASLMPPTEIALLHPLLRDFVGHLAIEILLGPDFLKNYPSALSELFALDSSLSLLLSGLPKLFPALRPAVEARTRLLAALQDHHLAHNRYINGQDPGPKWPNISQISNVVAERIASFASAGDFDDTTPVEDRGMLSAIGNIVVLWALNVNANQVTFWMIFHIYSSPTLLPQIRDEIASHVSKQPATKTNRPRLSLNLDGLEKHSPLLQGSFLETMRWESGGTVYRFIHSDFTLTESQEDANVFGHYFPQTYLLRKGEYVCVPNMVHQRDARYFPNPETFDATRFWVRAESEVKQPIEADADDVDAQESNWNRYSQNSNVKKDRSKKTEPKTAAAKGGPDYDQKVKVDYKTMHPWGGGPTVCKGKKFAEGEVLTFVAAIVACWEMKRVDKKGNEVAWDHPGHKAGTGAVVPGKDVWVRLCRREGM